MYEFLSSAEHKIFIWLSTFFKMCSAEKKKKKFIQAGRPASLMAFSVRKQQIPISFGRTTQTVI